MTTQDAQPQRTSGGWVCPLDGARMFRSVTHIEPGASYTCGRGHGWVSDRRWPPDAARWVRYELSAEELRELREGQWRDILAGLVEAQRVLDAAYDEAQQLDPVDSPDGYESPLAAALRTASDAVAWALTVADTQRAGKAPLKVISE